MAQPQRPVTKPVRVPIKRNFVNLALRFANRASRLPGAMPIAIGSVTAISFATLAGAFGTGSMAIGVRLLFWTLLIGMNGCLYLAWFAWRVRKPNDWWHASLVGMVLLTLPLPSEVMVANRLASGSWRPAAPQTWLYGLGVGLVVLMLMLALRFVWPRSPRQPNFGKGALWRHGVRDPAELAAIVAEDHYCRLRFADGSSRLIHSRFSDLTAELAASDGLVLRRGLWAAADAITGIERVNRRVLVSLASGERVAASASGRAAMREAGWL